MTTRNISYLIVTLCVLTCGAFSNAQPAAAPTKETLAALQARMEKQLNEPRFAQAQWGVKVVALDTGKVVFAHNADKLMKPASNAKMYSTSLALSKLGPDYRIKTSFYAAAKPDANGVIHSNLIVYGRGDFSFASRFNNGDYSKSLKPVVDAITAAGIKRIEGDLIGDDSYFRGPPFGAEWTWDDLQEYYGAPVSALTIEDNCLDLVFKPGKAVGEPCEIVTKPKTSIMTFVNRTKTVAAKQRGGIRMYRPLGENTTYVWGQLPLDSKGEDESVSVATPALWFVTLLKEALAERGVTVTGGVQTIGWLERDVQPLDTKNLVEVASLESRPMSELVKNTLKPSQNQYAQLLVLQVGAASKEEDEGDERYSANLGMNKMRKFLAQIGIPRGMTLLNDGSGLSRSALVTPSASVQLLVYDSKQKYFPTFYDGLPIAGVDGTLRRRFKGTPAEGTLHAKTGSLGFVDSLSGYLTTKAGDKLAFSVMLNNFRGGGRPEIDSLVGMVVNFDTKLQ